MNLGCPSTRKGSVATAQGKVARTEDEGREPGARTCQARGLPLRIRETDKSILY